MKDERRMVVDREVLAWPGVAKEPGRFDRIADTPGPREIAHVHRNGVIDRPFPRTDHDGSIAAGRVGLGGRRRSGASDLCGSVGGVGYQDAS